jgi:hypothetical protein
MRFTVRRPIVLRRQTSCGSPDLQVGDGPITLLPYGDELLGFHATQQTHVWRAPVDTSLPDLFATSPTLALARSGTCPNQAAQCGDYEGAALDACGAWITCAERDVTDPKKIRVFYHQETACDYAVGTSYKSVGYAESLDGITFSKPGHPANAALMIEPVQSCRTDPALPCWDYGWGDFTAAKYDDYFYMYSNKGVARAPLTSGGEPGSWSRWFAGDWTGAGPVMQPDGDALFDTTGRYLDGIKSPSVYTPANAVMLTGTDTELGGMIVAFSTNGATGWQRLGEPLFIADRDWTFVADLNDYVSVYGLDHTHAWSDAFEVLHSHRPGGSDGCKVVHVQRQVDVTLAPSAGAPQVRVELSRYYNANAALGPDHWVTTAPIVEPGYAYEGVWGYVMTVGGPGRVPLWDCYRAEAGDHENSTTGCGANTPARIAGYLFSEPQPGTHALYRCAWETAPGRINHITGTDCDGLPVEAVLGYAFD